jgi:hypothetical protein
MRPDLIKPLREVEPHGANEFVFVVATGIRMMDFSVRFVAEHSYLASFHTVQFPPGHPLIGRF